MHHEGDSLELNFISSMVLPDPHVHTEKGEIYGFRYRGFIESFEIVYAHDASIWYHHSKYHGWQNRMVSWFYNEFYSCCNIIHFFYTCRRLRNTPFILGRKNNNSESIHYDIKGFFLIIFIFINFIF